MDGGDGGDADHQIRTLPMKGEARLKNGSFDASQRDALSSKGRVGGGIMITRPSVALRDGDLGYGLKSQADLVIRAPMGAGAPGGR